MLKYGIINGLAVVSILILSFLDWLYDIPWWGYLILVSIWVLITLSGSFFIRLNYYLTALNSNKNTTKNELAISFDDGPHPEFTPQILGLLKQFNAKATFFCIGKNVDAHGQILEKIIAEGHTVGNHTYSHSNSFGFFSTVKVIAELQKVNTLVKKITGKEMRLYRPAFGVTNPKIKKAIIANGMQPIGWSVRSLDTTNRTQDEILKRITSNLAKGDIILLHDTSTKTVAVLEQLLLFLQQKKLQSVTIDQLLQIEAYA